MGTHYLDVSYNEVTYPITDTCTSILNTVERAESFYQRLLLIKQGRTDQEVAAQLFKVPSIDVSQDMLNVVADITAAVTVFHELYLFMNNGVVTQVDRMDDLRKFAF